MLTNALVSRNARVIGPRPSTTLIAQDGGERLDGVDDDIAGGVYRVGSEIDRS
jgi:hypothetical protein